MPTRPKRTRETRQGQAVMNTIMPQLLQGEPASSPSLLQIWPGWGDTDERERISVGLPASAASYFSPGHHHHGLMPGHYGYQSSGTSEEGEACLSLSSTEKNNRRRIMPLLPLDRGARYAILHKMAMDPTINCALQMHIANALAPRLDTGESISIVSADGSDNKIVDDLANTIMPIVHEHLNEIAWKTAIYGTAFMRVYGREKVGIESVRCDYYTHPRFVQKYSKAGRLAGYTTNYQNTRQSLNGIKLLPPWYFVAFDIPEFWDNEVDEPINVLGNVTDLALEDFSMEGLIESQDYGMSLLATAYGPWLDLLDALCSLRMSRRNAARLERIIGVNIGKLDPERAARYVSMIADRITASSSEIEKQSWLDGYVNTVVNHIIPQNAEKGSLQIDAVQGTPDINGLEDVLFHIKRLGAALGVDPSMLGFGDLLSGGLGDGGYFRMSVLAGSKAQFLRQAIKNGLDRLCELHIAYKHGKFFTFRERPWKIVFNAINTAIAREAQENMDAKANSMVLMLQGFGMIDQEFGMVDKRELAKFLWGRLDLDSETFETVFPEGQAEKAAAEAEEAMEGEEDLDGEEGDLEDDEDFDDEDWDDEELDEDDFDDEEDQEQDKGRGKASTNRRRK